VHLGAEMVQCESAVFIGCTLKCLLSANLFWVVDYHVQALVTPPFLTLSLSARSPLHLKIRMVSL
jgi:hypothetical protein